jgi:hypothetical protein
MSRDSHGAMQPSGVLNIRPKARDDEYSRPQAFGLTFKR